MSSSFARPPSSYAGVPAIQDVDFELRRGEIHALVGENGAGKSTLTKAMAGVVTLTSGSMFVNGVEAAPQTPLEARHLGIAMVFQENSLVPTMTVAQNLFLGQEKFYNRLRGIYIAAQQFLQSLNFDVTPTMTVGLLGAAKKQMVEIARAVLHQAQVIVFDEPTASLTPEEKNYFFDLVRSLKQRGVSIVFISHALEEALLLADRITVLRDGKHVVTDDASKFDRARIVQAMVGRDLSNTLYGKRKTDVRPAGERVLTVQNLKMAPMVKNNSLSVFAGQVTGVFGLVGAGRTETFKIVAGVLKRDFFHGGEILLRGKPVRYRVPAPAVRAGIAYVTDQVVRKGRLQPGKLFLVDLERGVIVDDAEVKREIAGQQPYGEWFEDGDRPPRRSPARARGPQADENHFARAPTGIWIHAGGPPRPARADGGQGRGADRLDGQRRRAGRGL